LYIRKGIFKLCFLQKSYKGKLWF